MKLLQMTYGVNLVIFGAEEVICMYWGLTNRLIEELRKIKKGLLSDMQREITLQ
jgi:hypothetical protein